jgi:hypothetical protein
MSAKVRRRASIAAVARDATSSGVPSSLLPLAARLIGTVAGVQQHQGAQRLTTTPIQPSQQSRYRSRGLVGFSRPYAKERADRQDFGHPGLLSLPWQSTRPAYRPRIPTIQPARDFSLPI